MRKIINLALISLLLLLGINMLINTSTSNSTI
jgi:hypothetical protein